MLFVVRLNIKRKTLFSSFSLEIKLCLMFRVNSALSSRKWYFTKHPGPQSGPRAVSILSRKRLHRLLATFWSTSSPDAFKENCKLAKFIISDNCQKNKNMKLFAATLALVQGNALTDRLAVISGHVDVRFKEK